MQAQDCGNYGIAVAVAVVEMVSLENSSNIAADAAEVDGIVFADWKDDRFDIGVAVAAWKCKQAAKQSADRDRVQEHSADAAAEAVVVVVVENSSIGYFHLTQIARFWVWIGRIDKGADSGIDSEVGPDSCSEYDHSSSQGWSKE